MRSVLLLAASLTALAACGLRGDLERPMPLWGDPPLDGPTDPRVIKAAEDAAAAEKAHKDAERKAADEARREQMEQQAAPAETPPQ